MARNHLLLQRLASILLLSGFAVLPVLAQGRIIPELPPRPVPAPQRGTPLHLKYLTINTEITDGVAVTTVKQTFRNQSRHQIEGTYVFPLPDNAAVGSFSMTINGKKLHGEVLDKETARRTYEQIVRRMRDPGLLEYLGSRLYRASIFPIPPGGIAEVELQYAQTLRETGGLGLFQHPLRSTTPGGAPIEQLVFHVKLRSGTPLASVFCPTHECEILRPNDHEATVGFERSNVRPDTDFQLYYQRSDAMFGISLLTHRSAGEPGFFLLRISPRIEISDEQIQAKDIAFVIDTSGSMRAHKLEQAKEALKFCVNGLRGNDRFNIYTFSTEVHPFRDGLVKAGSDVKAAAVEFAGKLEAIGGTNINQALLAALAADPNDGQRPYLIVFMTDGKPTVDVTDPKRILKNVADKNSRRVRFHVLGVGNEVNTHLLDKLAEMNRGSREYCGETEDLELKLSALVTRLANPVLTGITLAIADLKTSDIYPQTLPDLFRGNDVVVLGRYEGSGEHAVQLSGRLLDENRTIVHEGAFPAKNAENDFLPRLWAHRKVAYLLDQIRLHGGDKELVDEVVRLAKRYAIVMPYTSALILEDDDHIAVRPLRPNVIRWAPEQTIVDAARRVADGEARATGGASVAGPGAAPTSVTSGKAAVRASRLLYEAKQANVSLDLDSIRDADGKQIIRHVGEKTFVFDGRCWFDTAWDGKAKPKRITVFNDEYFALLEQHPRLARFFALGERVVVVFEGAVYETVPESSDDEQSENPDNPAQEP